MAKQWKQSINREKNQSQISQQHERLFKIYEKIDFYFTINLAAIHEVEPRLMLNKVMLEINNFLFNIDNEITFLKSF